MTLINNPAEVCQKPTSHLSSKDETKKAYFFSTYVCGISKLLWRHIQLCTMSDDILCEALESNSMYMYMHIQCRYSSYNISHLIFIMYFIMLT